MVSDLFSIQYPNKVSRPVGIKTGSPKICLIADGKQMVATTLFIYLI
jgi:hypothetical protein